MILKEKNIEIKLEENRVTLSIKEDSDLVAAYCFIKNLIKNIEWIPQSIYILRNDSVKVKKSLSRFKYMSFWDFLDIKEGVDDSLIYKSESFEWINIIGWEVRYKIEPKYEDLKNLIEKSLRDEGVLIEELKKNDK